MSEHEARKMLEELVRHGLMERGLSASGEETWRMTELGRQLGERKTDEVAATRATAACPAMTRSA